MSEPDKEKRDTPTSKVSSEDRSGPPPRTNEWRLESTERGSYMVLEDPQLHKILVG